MNVLIVAVGSYGDVLPLVGLGRELCFRGNDVTFFTNAHFAELVQHAKLNFVPLGTVADYDAIANHPDLWHPHKGWRLIMKRLYSVHMQTTYSTLCNHLKPEATVIVSSTLGFAARLVQETHKIPHATVHFSPGVFHSAYQPPKMPNLPMPDWLPVWVKQGIWAGLDYAIIDPVVKPQLNRFRHHLGLPPVSRIFHTWMHSPDVVLGLFPDWFATPQPDWPSQTVLTGFPLYDDVHDSALPTAVQTFLEAHPQPLVFTPGSANKHGKTFFAEATTTCQEMNRPGIFLTRYPDQLPQPLPRHMIHFSYVPLSLLLPHCAALIHHGGIGTCSQALQAGIPQLIRPYAFDQFDNGRRVEKLGVGLTLAGRSFRSARIIQSLDHILTSCKANSAYRTIKEKFNAIDPLAESCSVLETLMT